MIYNSFFGLSEEPFGVTPDPKFLYLSAKHQDALAHLQYGIRRKRGFIMLTGEVGSGKTTTVRRLFQELEGRARTAVILNPSMNALELLKFINHDFGLPVGRSPTHKSLMDDLRGFLLQCRRDGEEAVLVIDEAQQMSHECLEFLRLLSTLETSSGKLLQVILVGQTELRDIVKARRLRQLNQRIAVRYHLEPLDRKETAEYIGHRLRVAGSTTVEFPPSGIKAIHRFSRGVPRLINLFCDRALLAAYAKGTAGITSPLLKEVRRELEGQRKSRLAPAFAGLAIIVLVAFLLFLRSALSAH